MAQNQKKWNLQVLNSVLQTANYSSTCNLACYPDNKDLADLLVQHMFRWNTRVRTAKNSRKGTLGLNHGLQIYINRIANTGSFTLDKTSVSLKDFSQYF